MALLPTTPRGIACAILAAAFALCGGSVDAQSVSPDDEFIPASNEPCGVACPNPNAPLSRANYPPQDDKHPNMFVPTEDGLDLVLNPNWDGNWYPSCGMMCLDPDSAPSVKNPYRRNDTSGIQILVREKGEDVLVSFDWNPHWVVPGRLATVEGTAVASGIEAIVAGSSMIFSQLALLRGVPDLDAEEPDGKAMPRNLDRANGVYHASGDDVFQAGLLRSIGGVLSQGTVSDDSQNGGPKVKFVLKLGGGYPGYVLVSNGAKTGRYPIPYADLVPMALFVNSGGTSLYTLWEEDKLPANFPRAAGFSKYDSGPGFVALEFARTRYASALHFLDICWACEMVPDRAIEAAAVARRGSRPDCRHPACGPPGNDGSAWIRNRAPASRPAVGVGGREGGRGRYARLEGAARPPGLPGGLGGARGVSGVRGRDRLCGTHPVGGGPCGATRGGSRRGRTRSRSIGDLLKSVVHHRTCSEGNRPCSSMLPSSVLPDAALCVRWHGPSGGRHATLSVNSIKFVTFQIREVLSISISPSRSGTNAARCQYLRGQSRGTL